MDRRRAALLIVGMLVLCASASAEVQNRIKQHNPDVVEGRDWHLPLPGWIEIIQGLPGETFEFEAVLEENGQYVGPGYIDQITAVANAGPVPMTVVAHDGHPWGAATIGSINLSAAGVDSEVTALRTQSSIGSLGPILVDRVSGSFYVGTLINNVCEMETLAGDIDCLAMRNLTVSAGTVGPPYPSITIRSGYARTMDVTGSLHNLDIAGALSADGDIEIRGAEHDLDSVFIRSGDLAGTLNVGRDLLAGDVYGNLAGSLTVGRDLGTLATPATGLRIGDPNQCGHGISGTLTVKRDARGFIETGWINTPGSVTVDGNLDRCNVRLRCWPGLCGPLTVKGDVTEASTLTITGRVTSTLDVQGSFAGGLTAAYVQLYDTLSGKIWIHGDLRGDITLALPVTPTGVIEVGAQLSAGHKIWLKAEAPDQGKCEGRITVGAGLAGTLDVHGPMTGTVEASGPTTGRINLHKDLTGFVDVRSPLEGDIAVDGSFISPGRIHIGAMDLQTSAFLSVDNDGWHLGHEWDPNAYVRIGTQEPYEYFYGNTPDRHLYHITCKRGDCDNTDEVDDFDIDPFVLALTNESGYAQTFPGLGSSRWYHADVNCDGIINNFDIDAFVLRLTDPPGYWQQYPECENYCPPEGGDARDCDALCTANLYKQYLAPERLPYVIDGAEFLAGWYRGTPRGKFWTEVHAALVK
jgi:hypothetical protein